MNDRILLCGLGNVGFRILEQLLQLETEVTVVTLPEQTSFIEIARQRKVKVIEGNILDPELLLSAGLKNATCLILATDNDKANLETALRAKEIRPDLPVVIRVFDQHLAESLERAFGIRRALSTAAVAAPAFAAAALGDHVLHSVLLDKSLLLIQEMVCDESSEMRGKALEALPGKGLAVMASSDPGGTTQVVPSPKAKISPGQHILFGGVAESCQVLCRLLGSSTKSAEFGRQKRTRTGGHSLFELALEAYRNAHPGLKIAFSGLVIVLVSSTIVFRHVFKTSLVDAFYFTITTMTTVGYGDYSVRAHPAWVKLFVSLVMLASFALAAITFGVITDFVVRARFREIFGLQRSLLRRHIVIAGSGKLGYQVADYLSRAGEKLVVIERNADNDFVESLRGSVPIIIGDARLPHTLTKAAIERAKAVVAVTSDDLTNLSVILNARSVNPGIRTVLRMFDAERSQRIRIAFRVDAVLSTSAVAAPSFAAAALDPTALRAFCFGGGLVVLHRLCLDEKTSWAGQTAGHLRQETKVVPLALRRGRQGYHSLTPDTVFRPGDEIVVAAPWQPLAGERIDFRSLRVPSVPRGFISF